MHGLPDRVFGMNWYQAFVLATSWPNAGALCVPYRYGTCTVPYCFTFMTSFSPGVFLISHCIFALNQSPRQVHYATRVT